jgi:hypothetical protein
MDEARLRNETVGDSLPQYNLNNMARRTAYSNINQVNIFGGGAPIRLPDLDPVKSPNLKTQTFKDI